MRSYAKRYPLGRRLLAREAESPADRVRYGDLRMMNGEMEHEKNNKR
jgi:hypothetical protein